MEIINLVTSLQLSKKLKDLNVEQDSLFCWITDYDVHFVPTEIRNNDVCIAAFTSDELNKFFPNESKFSITVYRNMSFDKYSGTAIGYEGSIYFDDNNEANIKANILINLILKNLISDNNA